MRPSRVHHSWLGAEPWPFQDPGRRGSTPRTGGCGPWSACGGCSCGPKVWAALFVYHVGATWSAPAVRRLCLLDGQLPPVEGPCVPYLLLAGIGIVLATVAAVTFGAAHAH